MEIRRDIPPPKAGSSAKYPFGELAVEECLEIEGAEQYERARGALSMYRKAHMEKSFTCRKTESGGRIWRTL